MDKCIYVPTIKKDSIEYPSRLFLDLLTTFQNDRNVAIPIYVAATQMKDLFNLSNLDNLGEPKIDAVIKTFDLLNKNSNDFSQDSLEKYLNAKTENGVIYYNSYNNAYEHINSFNKKNGNKVGIIKFEKGKGYYISIEDLNSENLNISDTQRVVYDLNPKFKKILNEYGFDVQRIENLEEKGVFSPEDAEKNANGFIDIIKLSKGLEGDYAFSEEFCHFVIAGLKNNTLVQRMFNFVNIDVAKEILGNQYDIYKEKYSGATSQEEVNNLLREEAIGKLLAENIISNTKQDFVNDNLFNRFKNAVISFFKDKNEKEIEKIITEARQSLNDITEKIQTLDKDFFENFSKSDVLKSKNLYKINENITSEINNISKRILELSMKEEKIARIKAPGNTAEERKEFIERKKTNLSSVKSYFNSGQHLKNCLFFLQNTTLELVDLMKTLEDARNELKKNKNETIKFGKCCYLLNSIRDFSSTYREVITNLLTIKDPNLSTQDEKIIKDLSTELLGTITELDKSYIQARFDIVKGWLETYYWKNNIKTGVFNDKGEEIYLTLESLLREAPKDINSVDLYLAEMGHCSDVMLNLISTIHKKQLSRRDQKLEDIYLRANNIHRDLNEDTEFMYERDSNNNLTGRLISDIDFDAYELAKELYTKEINESTDLDEEEKRYALDDWYLENTEEVVVDKVNNRKERLPISTKYHKTGWDSRLSTAQKKYYNEMIQLKAEMETLLGPTNYHVYDAPQMSSDYIQKITDSSSVKDKFKFAFSELKHQIVRESDDIDFGEYEEDNDENNVINVTLDMRKTPIKKIPVFFVHKLKDMNRLNTDFTKAICAYSAMSVNYSEMSTIINQIETFKDLLLDREVAQYSGDSLMMNIIKDGQNIMKETFTKKGELTNIGERLQKYIDMNFYGMQKQDEGYVKLGKTKVDVAKAVDNVVKNYTGMVNLGINPFSGFSNISMGEVQMIIEAMANSGMSLLGGKKDTFGLRDWLWAHKEYSIAIPKIIVESESLTKTSKVGLLMRKFDTEQNFYDKLKSSGFYSNTAKRLFGNNTITYIMQNCGEHYLHTNLMLAMLHSKKVLLNGKEVSLYDAYEVKDNKIVEKGEIKELDGSKFTNDKFIDFKLKIQELSHQFNGAFASEDLGTLQQKSWGRLLMQFRQWMPGHWGRRFAKKYYNTATKQYQEGYWQTVYRVLWKDVLMSLIKTKRSIPEYWGSLSNYEKTNLMKAGVETMLILALSLLIKSMFSDDDDDDEERSRLKQFLKYQAKRTYMEMVATCPIMLNQMVKNSLTMLQSPSAAIKTFDNAWNLIRLDHLADEIESGTYKGMSVYYRDLLKALPYYGQIKKYMDLATEDYMFNLFDNTNKKRSL